MHEPQSDDTTEDADRVQFEILRRMSPQERLAEMTALERENSRLKRIVAEQAMDIDALKEIASKKW
jgi:hypothetical protein